MSTARLPKESTAKFLRDFMVELHEFVTRVYTVLPRPS